MPRSEIIATIGGALLALGGTATITLGPAQFPEQKEAIFWAGVIVFTIGTIMLLLALIFPLRRHSLPPAILAQGGKGGDAIASNFGTAYAGPGGSVAIGGQGTGGTGGSAVANSPTMESAGGAGGSVGSDRYWPHPAKSGYEIAMLAKGLPTDAAMRSFGRGGAVPGYEEKLRIVSSLRDAYFAQNHLQQKSYFEDINAVPVDHLNLELTRKGLPWRVKIVDLDEYDFYIP